MISVKRDCRLGRLGKGLGGGFGVEVRGAGHGRYKILSITAKAAFRLRHQDNVTKINTESEARGSVIASD